MNNAFDAIIVGVGAMGSAAACHLAQRNKKVLGIDRFTPPHSFGSSHGQTRIIREAYFEDPQYVPLIQKAYENWEKLERDSGKELFLETGGLMIGEPQSELVQGARLSAELHHLPHEILNAHEIHQRFPAFHPTKEMIGVWEEKAGILFPEECIEANLSMANEAGAIFHLNEPAISWKSKSDGVCVTTPKGEYFASYLLFTAGAWLKELIPDYSVPLTIQRQLLFWFEPNSNPEYFDVGRFPVYLCSFENDRIFYGFPDLGEGVKVARHHEGEMTDPELINRNIELSEVESMRTLLKQILPDANGHLRSATVCMYTNTPDFHFRIFFHPAHSNVLIASICSGHGFKFASAFGEILTDILLEKNLHSI